MLYKIRVGCGFEYHTIKQHVERNSHSTEICPANSPGITCHIAQLYKYRAGDYASVKRIVCKRCKYRNQIFPICRCVGVGNYFVFLHKKAVLVSTDPGSLVCDTRTNLWMVQRSRFKHIRGYIAYPMDMCSTVGGLSVKFTGL